MTVPNWKTERYLLGELPESEMNALKALENERGEFYEQLELLRSSNKELLAKYPAKTRKFAVIEPIKNRWLVPLSACAAVLIAATAMIAVFSGEASLPQNAVVISENGTRIKGLKTGLEIWRKTADSTEKLANNNEARAGDLLQIRYAVPEQCYGVLLSLDGNGVLTIHLSGKQGKAVKLEAGKTISLESAYELDNAPKFETFYLLTANKEFALAPVAENILQGKTPKDVEVTQITLKKR